MHRHWYAHSAMGDLLGRVSLAPALIGGMVQDLKVHKRSRGVSADARLVPGVVSALCEKAVREAPCGCGSGRAYHRCCGAH